MNDCLLLILSFLTGWYICNRYHERNRLVEGLGKEDIGWIILLTLTFVILFLDELYRDNWRQDPLRYVFRRRLFIY